MLIIQTGMRATPHNHAHYFRDSGAREFSFQYTIPIKSPFRLTSFSLEILKWVSIMTLIINLSRLKWQRADWIARASPPDDDPYFCGLVHGKKKSGRSALSSTKTWILYFYPGPDTSGSIMSRRKLKIKIRRLDSHRFIARSAPCKLFVDRNN